MPSGIQHLLPDSMATGQPGRSSQATTGFTTEETFIAGCVGLGLRYRRLTPGSTHSISNSRFAAVIAVLPAGS